MMRFRRRSTPFDEAIAAADDLVASDKIAEAIALLMDANRVAP